MFRRLKLFSSFIFFIAILLITFFPANSAQADTIAKPFIIKIDQSRNLFLKPLIIGLTPAGTEVLVYIDGNFVGNAQVKSKGTPTDNFYFYTATVLEPGRHTAMVIAKDKVSLVLSPVSTEIIFNTDANLSAPILIAPNETTATSKVKPFITGLTKSNSLVKIYIDGIYNGKTKLLTHESGTANFAYQPFLNLTVGEHTVWAIAENEIGQKSIKSNILNFTISQPLPAPVLKKTVVNKQVSYNQPLIVGLAKNDLSIKVFIDKKLDGQFNVTNHESGTANFAYKTSRVLTAGKHLAYTVAIDSKGKESAWSNFIYFNVQRIAQPAITVKAAEASWEEEAKSVEDKIEAISEPVPAQAEEQKPETESIKIIPIKGDDKAEEKAEPTKQPEAKANPEAKEIENLIKQSQEETKKDTGLITETKEKQSKLQLNLIIFILFLFAVIIWIFWVNRELIKERREQNKSAEQEKANKETKQENKNDSSRLDI